MSPLWRDRVGVGIYPDSLTWVRASRGLRPRVIDSGALVLSQDVPYPDQLQTGLRKLIENQTAEFPRKRATYAITLCAALTRSALLPWPGVSISDVELEALARASLRRIYSDIDHAWTIRTKIPVYGEPGIAIAMPIAVLSCVEGAFTAARASLESIEPLLIRAGRAIADRTPKTGLYGVAFSDRTSSIYGLLSGHKWLVLRQSRNSLAPDSILAACKREAILAGCAEVGPIFAFAGDEQARSAKGEHPGVTRVAIDGLPLFSDGHRHPFGLADLGIH